jgi:Xaa-Pro aminopeptidase
VLKNRIKALKTAFKRKFDGYIVADPFNLLYFTELLGAADSLGALMMLVPSEGENILYVYGVNYEWIKAEARNCSVELVKRGEDIVKKIAEQVRSQKLKPLGFDAMNVLTYQKLSKALKNTRLEAKSEYIWNLRRIKDADELKKMRKAAELTVEGMQTAYETIKSGVREYEVAAEIEYTMRTHGSYGVAFDTIVASGLHSAYPHGGCSERKFKNGDLVVVDIGAIYRNYRADMTRTFVVGKPSAKQEKIYTIVKMAQEKAFQKMREGVKAAEPDAVARGIIDKAGYGECFVHGLGHGVGLEVHEQPVLNSTSKDVLEAGNVVTDEPGIYIVGFGGFRIEDTVLIEKGKSERLTERLYVLKKS